MTLPLALCYYQGYGVAQDYKQAAYWYRKAAMQGYAGGEGNLGTLYAEGHLLASESSRANIAPLARQKLQQLH